MATPEDLGDEEFDSLEALDELGDPALDDDLDDDGEDDADDADDADNPDDAKEAAGDKPDSAADDEDDADDLDTDDDTEEQEESLDVILAREQDLEEEFAGVGTGGTRATSTTTPAGEGEFTCRSCFLVKRQAQLADPEEMICLDCA